MDRLIQFILFFTVFSGILFGLHFYIFRMISKHLELSPKIIGYIRWFFIISGISIIIGQVLSRFADLHFIKYYAYIWLGVVSITFSFFIIASILKIFFPAGSKIIVLSTLVLSILVSLYSIINNASVPEIKEINIVTTKDTGSENEFRIVQLSDVHIDESSNMNRVQKLVDRVNSLKPDLILITGDLIDGQVHEDCELSEIMRSMRSRFGVYAVSGNHEFYTGIDVFNKLADRSGITILRDEKKTITDSFTLIGLKDHTSAKAGRKNFKPEILKGLDRSAFNILMGHRPYGIENNSQSGVDLQLAGHTHAGQIPPMDILVQLVYRYPNGLYRSGNSYIYTTSGTGVWGPPMRFLSRSEIVLFRITQGENISGRISK
ncbi:MAG: metallophosphoesterase [Acidobacteriota bacterium]